jgi:hypothetical protein
MALFKKVMVAELLKNFSAFCGTVAFITVPARTPTINNYSGPLNSIPYPLPMSIFILTSHLHIVF